jgi:hypothetical protein
MQIFSSAEESINPEHFPTLDVWFMFLTHHKQESTFGSRHNMRNRLGWHSTLLLGKHRRNFMWLLIHHSTLCRKHLETNPLLPTLADQMWIHFPAGRHSQVGGPTCQSTVPPIGHFCFHAAQPVRRLQLAVNLES